MAGDNSLGPIIRLVYDPSQGLPKMVADARGASEQIKRQFDSDFAEIGRLAGQALSKGLTSSSAVNLNVGEFRTASAEARAYRLSLDAVRSAAVGLAQETGDTSAATAKYLQALSTQVIEARNAERATEAQLATYTRLQSALNTTSSDISALARSYRELELARNADNIAAAKAEVGNRRFTEFDQSRGIGASVSSSARQSAAVFEAMFRAEEEAARGMKQLAGAAASLRAQIDPLYLAQVRLDQEMNRADDLLRAGAIGQREYAQATQLARDALQQENAAIHATGNAAGIGTTANHLLVNSTRSLRIATLQAGQQVQDMGISLYSGQRAGVVFAQQLPQLAFALSYLEGSANKTHDRIGRFATFLSGPWGLAVGLGVGVLVQLVAGLFNTEDASEKAGSATDQLKNKLDLSKNSYETLIAVVNEYNKAQEKSEALTYGAIVAAEEQAAGLIKLAEAKLAVLKASDPALNASSNLDAINAETGNNQLIRFYEGKLKELETNLNGAQRAGANFRVAQRLNPEKKIQDDADLAITQLAARQEKERSSIQAFEDDKFRILKKAEDDIEAYRKTKRDAEKIGRAGASNRQSGREVNSAEARAIAEAAGFQVNSADRSNAKQRRLYAAFVAAGRPAGSPVAVPGTSAHERGNALDIQGGPGVSTASIRKAFAEEGVRLTKVLKEPGKGIFHIEFSTSGAEKVQRDAEQLAEQAKRLAEFGREAGVSIIAMNDRFSDAPAAVRESQAALEQINDLIGQLADKQPTGFKEMIASLEAMKPAAEALRDGPFNDMVKAAEEQVRIQQLLIEGRIIEAEMLDRQLTLKRQQNPLSAQQLADLRAMVVEQRKLNRDEEKSNALRQQQIQLINATQDNIRQTTYELLKGDGFGAIGNLFKRQFDLILQDMATTITDDLFSQFFADRKEEVLNTANKEQAAQADKVTTALERLEAAALGAANSLEAEFDKTFGVPGAANDNPAAQKFGEIIVTANRSTGQIIKSALSSGLKTILGQELFDRLGGIFKSAVQGAAFGQVGGGLVGKNNIGASIGGIVGQAIGNAVGKSIGGALGSALGPIGGILGGALGGLIGSIFSKAKTGSASVSGSGIISGGNNSEAQKATSGLGSNVQGSINRIIEALGGTAGNYGFTIGSRKDEYRVSGSSGADVTSKKPKNLLYKGKDPEEAARIALLNAIQDGAVAGISAGAQRLLQAGTDLDAALKKALDFQGVFDRLRAYKDPVGAALDTLNKEFTRLKTIFGEAGASAADYAQLEELYGIERAKAIKDSSARITGSLKGLLDELLIGGSGLSLRDRKANAKSTYDPLAARVAAGDVTAFNDYATAARALLDIERQISGSQSGYFDLFGQIKGLTQSTLDAQNATAANSTAGASPFSPVAPANDNVVGAISNLGGTLLDGLGFRLDAMNRNLGTLILQGQATGTYPGIPFNQRDYF